MLLDMVIANDELATECLRHLGELPFVRQAQLRAAPADSPWDGLLRIKTPEGRQDLPCKLLRSHVTKESAQLIVHLSTTEPAILVMALSVGKQIGELFQRHGVNFVDTAGNCSVQLDMRYVARIEGRHRTQQVRSSGMRAPAYRVLFALLARPQLLAAPARVIAAAVDVSPQTANETRRRLIDQALMLKTGRGHAWAPGRRQDAVALWLAGFSTSLAPSLLIGRFRAVESDPSELERRIEPVLDDECEWRYGGGAAAMRLTKHYRGDRTVIYLTAASDTLLRKLRLVRDASGPVLLARMPGIPGFDSPHPRCVHPLLAYADLLAEGNDRAAEAAAALHARYLTTEAQGD